MGILNSQVEQSGYDGTTMQRRSECPIGRSEKPSPTSRFSVTQVAALWSIYRIIWHVPAQGTKAIQGRHRRTRPALEHGNAIEEIEQKRRGSNTILPPAGKLSTYRAGEFRSDLQDCNMQHTFTYAAQGER